MPNDTEPLSPHIWEGVYESAAAAAGVGEGFRDDRWIKKITSQLEDYLTDVAKKGSSATPPRPSLLPFLCALTNPLSVLDLGGSSGWVWHYTKQCVPNWTPKTFNIIEIPAICQYFSNSDYHLDEPIQYVCLEEVDADCDVLYANSVLQYVCEDELFIGLIARARPSYILIEDFLGGAFEDFYSTQLYSEDKIPVKFRNRGKFLASLNNYQLILSKSYIATLWGKIMPLPMKNFPPEKRVEHGEILLLKKIECR
jgi:putative methyltransferase (TIGR04325 family)